MERQRASDRAVKFFGDILPESAFQYPKSTKDETNEICRILEEECGIKSKRLAILGEGSVTD